VLLEWLYRLLYYELAWSYDLVSWLVSGGRWREWQRQAVPLLVGSRILEIGPGPGHLLLELLGSGRDAYGLDLSPPMLAKARRRLGRLGWGSRLVRGDARHPPFLADSFDSIVATFPSAFILEESFADEVRSLLRPGGRLVVVLDAASGACPWPGLLEWLLHRAASGEEPQPVVFHWPGLDGRLTQQRGAFGTVSVLVATKTES
jgi:SAM-dependent methyltransferase